MHLLIALVFASFIGDNCSAEKRRRLNVGTVLFSECDITKECWSCENIALLTSKMLLEDVLPKRDVLIIQDNSFIMDVIDYFRLILEVVRRLTTGKTKHIMLLALTDTLGGYLYRYVIPTAKEAYYAGFINYDSMEKLLQLFTELKCFLRTNGHGWAKPITTFSKKMQAQALPVPVPVAKTSACKGLIYIDNSADSPSSKCSIIIPMPFFDSKKNPSAIAVPFKTYSLRNIESKSASYVLVKYYVAATKCLISHSSNRTGGTVQFNNDFFSWINVQVLPHLSDEKFYSAFGGVLRIEETLKKLGARLSDKKIGNYNIMPETQVQEYGKDAFKEPTGKQPCPQRKKSDLILLALLATIFVWFCLGSLFICYRIRATKSRKEDEKGDSKPFKLGGDKATSKGPKCLSTTPSSKITTSSGRISPTITICSDGGSPVPSETGSKRTVLSGASERSKKSTKSSTELACTGPCAFGLQSQTSVASLCTVCSKKRSQSSTISSSQKIGDGTCICNTAMVGNLQMSSMEDISLRNNQLVFGYDMESSSTQSSPRENSEEVDDYVTGNMSK